MRRAFAERQRALRLWRAHNRLVHAGMGTSCVCDQQPGRFRKGQKIGGCGKSRCWLCKGHRAREAADRARPPEGDLLPGVEERMRISYDTGEKAMNVWPLPNPSFKRTPQGGAA